MSDFPLPALPPSGQAGAQAPTTMRLISMAALESGWEAAAAGRVDELRRRDGRLAMAIDRHELLGYRLDAPGFGRYLLSPDGMHVQCAPRRLAGWRRERFLTARVIPLAASLRGLEVLHASAVAVDSAVLAIVGPSHSGKTSLAIQLVLEGARFVTDDVLALRLGDGGLTAHPGAAIAGVRYAEHRLLSDSDRFRLGRSNDRGDKVWTSLSRAERALPLRLVYFLSREAAPGQAAIEVIDPPDPRLLLGSSFLPHVDRSPTRLERQLATSALLARTAPSYRITVPSNVRASSLAAMLLAHARAALATPGRSSPRATTTSGKAAAAAHAETIGADRS